MNQQTPFIVTHAGAFHSDELMAIALLAKLYLPMPCRVAPVLGPAAMARAIGGQAVLPVDGLMLPDGVEDRRTPVWIFRTREPQVLDLSCRQPDVFVIDVGGRLDPDALNFDHHQAGMKEKWEDGTPLSSTGLIWRWLMSRGSLPFSHDLREVLEETLIRPLDAHDNGVAVFPAAEMCEAYNRNEINQETTLSQFSKALCFMEGVLDNAIYRARSRIECKQAVRLAWNSRPGGEDFVVLDKPLEYPDGTGLLREVSDGQAKLLGIPGKAGRYNLISTSHQGRFSVSCPMPENWRGRMAFEANLGDGMPPARIAFAHKTGFMCVVEGGSEQARRVARFVSAMAATPTPAGCCLPSKQRPTF